MEVMLKPGQTIKAGTLVLITAGSYSSYGVTGLFRATVDVVVPPPKPAYPYEKLESEECDTALLSTLLEEVPYVEAWRDA